MMLTIADIALLHHFKRKQWQQ